MVVSTLIATGIGGTFAGFVDTEESEGNFYQAGILDLLVNGKNDPIGAKLQYTHGVPCVSVDYWIDVLDWGECQGGNLYLRIKDIVSIEDGTKYHLGEEYVYDGVAPAIPGVPPLPGVPAGYRVAVGAEPAGAGVWSSEPEKIAEVGEGYVGQIWVYDDDPCLLGEDYASGIADHLDLKVEICDDLPTDGILDNADDNGDGMVDSTEYAAHNWIVVVSGKLASFPPDFKLYLGFLETQKISYIHCDVHLQQLECPDWPDPQTRFWPSNALQGDKATWSFMFELTTD